MRALAAAMFVVAALSGGGCAGLARGPAPPGALDLVAPVGFSPTVRYLGADRSYFVSTMDAMRDRLRTAAGGGPLNILALSGGGAGGAFGAGALVGASQRMDHPQFAVVTGVSTGALLAPYAFLGPAWNPQLTKAFGSDRGKNLLRSRGLGFLFSTSFYQGEPLADLVDEFVTDDLINAVAGESAKGRLLLVATTDLDKGETVIWDMGAIASKGGPEARALFAKVLVASSTIPGLFPPVMIPVEGAGRTYEEMHVDGGVTVPFFFAPEPAYVLPLEFEMLRGASLYILINGQLATPTQTTQATTAAVLTRSFDTTLRRSTRTTLELSLGFAQRYGVNLRFAQIPDDYAFPGSTDFDGKSMRELFSYASRCAEDGRLWTTIEQSMERDEPAPASSGLAEVRCPLAGQAP